jgi:hypothetical protein
MGVMMIMMQFTFPVSDFVPNGPSGYQYRAHEEWELGGAGPGGAMLEHGGPDGATSIWTALWTSCVPLDVREEFRIVTTQCIEDETCLPTRSCWPGACLCRCWSGKGRSGSGNGRKLVSLGSLKTPRGGAGRKPLGSSHGAATGGSGGGAPGGGGIGITSQDARVSSRRTF